MERNVDGSLAGYSARIFPVDDVFVVADEIGWVDGEFNSPEDAEHAAKTRRKR